MAIEKGAVLEYANQVSKRIEADHAGNVGEEFLHWLRIGLKREAMVTEAYNEANLREHLNRLLKLGLTQPAFESVRKAIGSAWAQEEAHRAYLSAILRVIDPPKTYIEKLELWFTALFGEIEGSVVAMRLSSSSLNQLRAQVAISLGHFVQEIPAFVSSLGSVSFKEFCEFNSELEETAIMGYLRMGFLMEEWNLKQENVPLAETTLPRDINQILLDERYHKKLFDVLGDLPPAPAGGVDSGTAQASQASQDWGEQRSIIALIAKAQREVYGGVAKELSVDVLRFDEVAIAKDPFVVFLRDYLKGTTILVSPPQAKHAAH